jgi:peptide/nickel transport system permease protein
VSVARVLRRPNLAIGGVCFAIFAAAAVAGWLWTPYGPLETNLLEKLASPSGAHWFGTDQYGRDILSRILAGAGLSMLLSTFSVLGALTAGTLVGLVSGYYGGIADRMLMMLTDALMAFPGILLALGIMTALGPNKWGVILALSIAYSPTVARVVRATVLSLRESDYVHASLAMGRSRAFALRRHVLPNCVAPLTVIATTLFGVALLAESALSFLGLGVPPPQPTLGGMLADSRTFLDRASWMAICPGVAISIGLLGVNLLGDALRDQLDPRMRGIL